MLGFKKKEKIESDGQDAPKKKTPKKKKKGSLKKWFFIILFLAALGTAAYFVYYIYVVKPREATKPVYKQIELTHINLPEEMLKFCFDYLPDLYSSMVSFNHEMELFSHEIDRIDAIAQKYPEQKKITDKEKKTWEKAKSSLEKAFTKIEKPVKETYVLFRVNKEQGLARIEEKKQELNRLALEALAPAKELTQKIQPKETIPQGFIKGNIYKLKKKFL